MCLLGKGLCRFYPNFSPNLRNRNVFFAYDSKSKIKELQQYLESELNPSGFHLDSTDILPPIFGQYICEKICKHIRECAFVIADIGNFDDTNSMYYINPNVSLEIGLANGLGKDTILIDSSNRNTDKYCIPSYYDHDYKVYNIQFSENEFLPSDDLNKAIQNLIKKYDDSSFDKITIVNDRKTYQKINLKARSLNVEQMGVHKRFPVITIPETTLLRRENTLYLNPNNSLEYYKNVLNSLESRDKTTKAIYSIPLIQKYFELEQGAYTYEIQLTKDEKEKQLDNFINMLLSKDFFQAALIDTIPSYYFQIYDKHYVWLYSLGENVGEQENALLLSTNASLDIFTQLFQQIWEKTKIKWLPGKKNEQVIQWLKDSPKK